MKHKIYLVEFQHPQEADDVGSLLHRVDPDIDVQVSLTSPGALLLLCTGQHLLQEELKPLSIELGVHYPQR